MCPPRALSVPSQPCAGCRHVADVESRVLPDPDGAQHPGGPPAAIPRGVESTPRGSRRAGVTELATPDEPAAEYCAPHAGAGDFRDRRTPPTDPRWISTRITVSATPELREVNPAPGGPARRKPRLPGGVVAQAAAPSPPALAELGAVGTVCTLDIYSAGPRGPGASCAPARCSQLPAARDRPPGRTTRPHAGTDFVEAREPMLQSSPAPVLYRNACRFARAGCRTAYGLGSGAALARSRVQAEVAAVSRRSRHSRALFRGSVERYQAGPVAWSRPPVGCTPSSPNDRPSSRASHGPPSNGPAPREVPRPVPRAMPRAADSPADPARCSVPRSTVGYGADRRFFPVSRSLAGRSSEIPGGGGRPRACVASRWPACRSRPGSTRTGEYPVGGPTRIGTLELTLRPRCSRA